MQVYVFSPSLTQKQKLQWPRNGHNHVDRNKCLHWGCFTQFSFILTSALFKLSVHVILPCFKTSAFPSFQSSQFPFFSAILPIHIRFSFHLQLLAQLCDRVFCLAQCCHTLEMQLCQILYYMLRCWADPFLFWLRVMASMRAHQYATKGM